MITFDVISCRVFVTSESSYNKENEKRKSQVKEKEICYLKKIVIDIRTRLNLEFKHFCCFLLLQKANKKRRLAVDDTDSYLLIKC